jgi:hypothetical protein
MQKHEVSHKHTEDSSQNKQKLGMPRTEKAERSKGEMNVGFGATVTWLFS